jgi:hypothetical protein
MENQMKPMAETLGEKLIRCGWVTNFNVKTLVRLIEDHFISRIPAAPAPISVNDRLPGPEDCDKRKYVWVYNGKHCPSYYTEPWRFQEIPTPGVSNWFWRNVTHWLPYYAIQIPTYTKTTNET